MNDYLNYDLIEEVLSNSKFNVDNYTVEDYKKVLNKLSDEQSKMLFFYRILHDNTRDLYYYLKLIETIYRYNEAADIVDLKTKKLIQLLLKNENYKKRIVMFGYNKAMTYLFSPKINCFKHDNAFNFVIYDEINDDCEYECEGIEVKPMSQFDEINNDTIYIILNPQFFYIDKYLIKNNVSKNNVFKMEYSYRGVITCLYFRSVQYFGETFMEAKDDEVYLDCGAYKLDSLSDFLVWCNSEYKKIYAFEPSKELYDLCLEEIKEKEIDNIEMINSGVFNFDGMLHFNNNGGSSRFKLEDDYNDEVKVCCIDDIVKDEKVTIIKMDVEGSESEALEGAKKTIIKNKPKLLISGYHIENDCIKLINQVLSYNPKYKIYIRHYNINKYETVIYFI